MVVIRTVFKITRKNRLLEKLQLLTSTKIALFSQSLYGRPCQYVYEVLQLASKVLVSVFR